jgi:hypothetical protein
MALPDAHHNKEDDEPTSDASWIAQVACSTGRYVRRRDSVSARRLTTVALVFSVVMAFAMPSRGGDLPAAVQKTLDAFCGMNLRYIEALFNATRTTCRVTN